MSQIDMDRMVSITHKALDLILLDLIPSSRLVGKGSLRRNKPGPSQVGAPLKFLKRVKDTIFKLLSISQSRKHFNGYA